MGVLDAERLKDVGPHVDRALELPQEERGPWLAALRVQNPGLAQDVETLLVETLSSQDGRQLGRAPTVKPAEPIARVAPRPDTPGSPAAGAHSNRTLGEFVLREIVGSGGFGDVYLAEQTTLRREAVVKVRRAGKMSDGGV